MPQWNPRPVQASNNDDEGTASGGEGEGGGGRVPDFDISPPSSPDTVASSVISTFQPDGDLPAMVVPPKAPTSTAPTPPHLRRPVKSRPQQGPPSYDEAKRSSDTTLSAMTVPEEHPIVSTPSRPQRREQQQQQEDEEQKTEIAARPGAAPLSVASSGFGIIPQQSPSSNAATPTGGAGKGSGGAQKRNDFAAAGAFTPGRKNRKKVEASPARLAKGTPARRRGTVTRRGSSGGSGESDGAGERKTRKFTPAAKGATPAVETLDKTQETAPAGLPKVVETAGSNDSMSSDAPPAAASTGGKPSQGSTGHAPRLKAKGARPVLADGPARRILALKIMEATGLLGVDNGGVSNPRVDVMLVDLAGRVVRSEGLKKTKVVMGTVSPTWREEFAFGQRANLSNVSKDIPTLRLLVSTVSERVEVEGRKRGTRAWAFFLCELMLWTDIRGV